MPIKLKSYTLDNKIFSIGKYIKIKPDYKLKTKFFRPFKVLYLIEKQVYIFNY